MSSSNSIDLGTILAGRYELMAVLADGGMGTVYAAVDRERDRKVAVKVLQARHLEDDAMRRRFRREGAVLKSLTHPAIVRLFELGADSRGTVYLVTEYVEGLTLADRLGEGPLATEEVNDLVVSVCGGLAAAHAHGILHGDLKPANVLWGEVPRLVDFSASKVLGLDRLTATGEISGTPAYMAPELLTGKAEVDERIDVYGMGVLLYEALSARRPFDEGHVGRLLMKIDAGDCLPLEVVAEVKPAVAGVVRRAMHRDKTRRYASVTDLLSAWREARAR